MSSERLARIEPFITRYVEEGKLGGIVTLIARRGKIVHFETVGKLNIETGEVPGEIPLLYQPGTRWVYSVSKGVLGRLGEVIAGKPLNEYLDEKLFTSLEMADTFFQVPDSADDE